MLCILKYEESIALFLPELLTGQTLPNAPDDLWQKNPKLDIVWIYAIKREPNSHALMPQCVFAWNRPRK
jgi:hypothetical protein